MFNILTLCDINNNTTFIRIDFTLLKVQSYNFLMPFNSYIISKTLTEVYTSYTTIKHCASLLTILSRIYQYQRLKAPLLLMATLHQLLYKLYDCITL